MRTCGATRKKSKSHIFRFLDKEEEEKRKKNPEQRGRREEPILWTGKIFEEIVTEKFPNLAKPTNQPSNQPINEMIKLNI